MSVVEGLKIQIHVCGTYVLSVWFTLLIGFGSVWIFSRKNICNNIFNLMSFTGGVRRIKSKTDLCKPTYSYNSVQ